MDHLLDTGLLKTYKSHVTACLSPIVASAHLPVALMSSLNSNVVFTDAPAPPSVQFPPTGDVIAHVPNAHPRTFQTMVNEQMHNQAAQYPPQYYQATDEPINTAAVNTVPSLNNLAPPSGPASTPQSPSPDSRGPQVSRNGLYDPADSVYRAPYANNRVHNGPGTHQSIIQTRAAKARTATRDTVREQHGDDSPLAQGDPSPPPSTQPRIPAPESDASASDPGSPVRGRASSTKRKRVSAGKKRQRKKSKRIVQESESDRDCSDIAMPKADKILDLDNYDTNDPFIDDTPAGDDGRYEGTQVHEESSNTQSKATGAVHPTGAVIQQLETSVPASHLLQPAHLTSDRTYPSNSAGVNAVPGYNRSPSNVATGSPRFVAAIQAMNKGETPPAAPVSAYPRFLAAIQAQDTSSFASTTPPAPSVVFQSPGATNGPAPMSSSQQSGQHLVQPQSPIASAPQNQPAVPSTPVRNYLRPVAPSTFPVDAQVAF
ncbi:hypothetical protein MD484_g8351, partial [Candolleomyces efflorescens]